MKKQLSYYILEIFDMIDSINLLIKEKNLCKLFLIKIFECSPLQFISKISELLLLIFNLNFPFTVITVIQFSKSENFQIIIKFLNNFNIWNNTIISFLFYSILNVENYWMYIFNLGKTFFLYLFLFLRSYIFWKRNPIWVDRKGTFIFVQTDNDRSVSHLN